MTQPNPTPPPNPSTDPTNRASGGPVDAKDPARYTHQQEREMGVRDDQGRTIQPSTSFVMIALVFVGIAAVGAVVVAIFLRFSGAPVSGQ